MQKECINNSCSYINIQPYYFFTKNNIQGSFDKQSTIKTKAESNQLKTDNL